MSEAKDSIQQLVRVWEDDRVQAGSCNACHNLDEETVTIIRLGSCEVRVCPKCREHLSFHLDTFYTNDKITHEMKGAKNERA